MQNEHVLERKMKQQKLRRKVRRGEIALKRIYALIRFIFILFLFYAVYRLAYTHYWFLDTNIYNTAVPNNNIEILGNKIVPNEKILEQMKKFPLENKPLYLINPAKISNEIEQLIPVKRAYVRRYWLPARLVVMVEEMTPVITVSPAENAPDVAAFSATGEMITREFLPLDEKLKTVKLLSYGTKGDDYVNWDKDKINNLYRLAKTIEEYSGEKVLYIDLRIPHNAFVQIETTKIRLGEIDNSVYERIKSIHDILPAIKKMNLKTKYIDLAWKDAKYIKEEI